MKEWNDTIIIDDIFIKYHKIFSELSKIFIVRRPYIDRQEAIKERDGLTKEEIVASDLAHYKENYKEIKVTKKVEIINNNGTQEELSSTVQKIYEQHFINFKDKYKSNNKPTNPRENSKIDITRRIIKGKETR